ncbi:hypothetical protein Tco_0965253 [Tanacetum coccineum]
MSRENPQAAIVSEEQVVLSDNRLKITKNNQRIASDSNIIDSFLRLDVLILKHYKLYKPISLTATVSMPPQVTNKPFTKPPTEKELFAFIKILGYEEDPKQRICLTGKDTSFDRARLPSIPRRSNADMHSEEHDSLLSKMINTVDGEFKFGMEIPYTIINDAIKQLVRYKYYMIKKGQSEKGNAKEKLEDQNVSLMRSGRGKGYMCLVAVELAKSVSIKEQRLQQRKIMTRLKIEKQVGKDVDKGYAAKRGLKLKGVATKDPAVQSLLALRKGYKESKLGHVRKEMQAGKGEGSSAARDDNYEFKDFS